MSYKLHKIVFWYGTINCMAGFDIEIFGILYRNMPNMACIYFLLD